MEKRERREREMARAKTKREGCCKKRKRAMTDGQRGEQQKTAEKASTHTHTVRPVAAAKRKRKITQPHPPLCGNSNFAFHLPAKSTRSIIATGSPATYKAPPPRPPQAKLFTQNRINRCLFDCFFLICGEGGRAVFFGRRSNKKLTKTDHKQRNPPSPSRCCAVCAQPNVMGGREKKKQKQHGRGEKSKNKDASSPPDNAKTVQLR